MTLWGTDRKEAVVFSDVVTGESPMFHTHDLAKLSRHKVKTIKTDKSGMGLW